ncbi:hypothetical protein MXB_4370, partial [Myxobolus squamalis]
IECLDHDDSYEQASLIPGKRGLTNCAHETTSIYGPEMLMVTTPEGQNGLIERSNVEFYQDSHLLLLDFYHGYTRTTTVDNLMDNAPPGSYLLRNSNLVHNALSLDIKCKCPEKIHHLRIINENSLFYVHDAIFKDIEDVI